MRKRFFAAAVTAAAVGMTLFAGSSATAATDDEGYPPTPPASPSLTGSIADGVCDAGAPWISYSITLSDPDHQATSDDAFLRLSGSGQSVDIPLGTIQNGTLQGRVLWPGASVDTNGNATGWPGWTQNASGEWVTTSGNFAWTRGAISAVIHANPQLAVPLSYPDATPLCANPSPAGTSAGELAYTGSTVSWIAVGAGVGALALGGGLLAMRRRRAHD